MNRLSCLVTAAAILTCGHPAAAADSDDLLTVGSKAPALEIEHWVSTGNGFDEVTTFEDDRVYVVEFWATWCGPCVQSMPHLAELQEDYAAKGVQFISVSDENLPTIEGFLERPVRGMEAEEEGEDPPTYADLTSGWSLTTDPDRSVSDDYMSAALETGIPTAFIVGKSGLIEWIGHPAAIDRVIAQVVDGSWDRDEFRLQYEPKQRLSQLRSNLIAAVQRGDVAAAKEMLTQHAADYGESPAVKQLRFELLMASRDGAGFGEEAVKMIREANDPRQAMQSAMMLASVSQELEIPDVSLTAAVDELRDLEVSGRLDALRLMLVGQFLFAAGDADEASKSFDAAVKAADNPDLKKQIRVMADGVLGKTEDASDDTEEE